MNVHDSHNIAHSRRVWRWAWFAAGALAVFVAALILALLFSPHFMLTSTQRAEMQRYLDGPLNLPPEWLSARPSAEMERRIRDLVAAEERVRSVTTTPIEWTPGWTAGMWIWRLAEAEPLSASERAELAQRLDIWQAEIEALAAMVEHPDYSAMNIYHASITGVGRLRTHQAPSCALARLGVAALEGAREGDFPVALRNALLVWRGAQVPPPNSMYEEILFSMMPGHHAAARAVAITVASCTDATLLSATLHEMNGLIPKATPPNLHALMTQEMVTWMEATFPLGASSAIPRTGRELLDRHLDDWFYRRGAGYNRSLSRRLRNVRRFAGGGPSAVGDLGTRAIVALEALGDREGSIELEYERVRRSTEYSHRKLQLAYPRRRAAFDLARLALAARIEELEGRPKPTRMADFVPRYFESPLLDPWSAQPYLFNPTHETFYSRGPDGRDDRMVRRHAPDPENGVFGDYWLEPIDGHIGGGDPGEAGDAHAP